ncbi:MAG: phosphodiester glycosidase family protein, partial [Thermoanaerobaculia bacterium]
MRHTAVTLPLVLVATLAGAQLPQSSLAIENNGHWRAWWTSSGAPSIWSTPSPIVLAAVHWTSIGHGVDRAEIRLGGTGEAWRIRVVLVRFDPRSVRAELVEQTRGAGTLGGWAVDSARAPAIAAVNAGQFSGGTPWGWLVRNGKEERAPGFGPLSMAVIEEEGGELRLLSDDSIPMARANHKIALAFQSYPTLLEPGGVVPHALQTESSGVDLAHRDSRLAIGELRDGRIILALTRFEALGGALSQLPFGPTIPEMSALMGALGCTKAVALDGGISGQMMI